MAGGNLAVPEAKKGEAQAAQMDADADLEARLHNLRRDWALQRLDIVALVLKQAYSTFWFDHGFFSDNGLCRKHCFCLRCSHLLRVSSIYSKWLKKKKGTLNGCVLVVATDSPAKYSL